MQYFIRHGQSVNNAGWGDPNYKESPDPMLTEKGVHQAQILADYLEQNQPLIEHKDWDPTNRFGFGFLVSASAGYGKTTLVAEWLRGIQAKTAWLSLDKADNDPARFLAYLIAALQQIDECIGENTRAILQSPQPLPPQAVLTSLVNEIACVPTSFVLVLDNYHVI